MDQDLRYREVMLKARLLRGFALIFAIAGLLVFLVLYVRNVQGSFFSALTNPFVITIILVPFLPAIVLSWLAGHTERQYAKKHPEKK
jgi:hypothetical protein